MTAFLVKSVQVCAMVDELVRIGVHGKDRTAVLEQLMLDQLKFLASTPGFGRDLLRAADEAGRKEEARLRSEKSGPPLNQLRGH